MDHQPRLSADLCPDRLALTDRLRDAGRVDLASFLDRRAEKWMATFGNDPESDAAKLSAIEEAKICSIVRELLVFLLESREQSASSGTTQDGR